MFVAHLHLEEFRVYRALDLDLPAAGARIVGPNGSGKSSVLEAVSLLSTAKSYRTGSDRELIRWGSGTDYGFPPYARCRGTLDATTHRTLEILLESDSSSDDDDVPLAIGPLKKRCLIDGRGVRAVDFVGHLRTVSFSPEDVALVSGPPADRRRFLDVAVSQIDRAYLQALSRYGRVIAQRNGLLRRFARDGVPVSSAAARAQLAFWSDELVEAGAVIVVARIERIRQLAEFAEARYAELTGGSRLRLTYRSSVPEAAVAPANDDNECDLDPDPDRQHVDTDRPPAVTDDVTIETALRFRDELDRRRPDEFRRGVTLVGPHRDDLTLTVDGVDLATYGSRGQQRLGVLATKLAEADLMRAIGEEPPVLLLDDVLSELDPERGRLLVETIGRYGSQTFVTATERSALEYRGLADLPILQTAAGTLITES